MSSTGRYEQQQPFPARSGDGSCSTAQLSPPCARSPLGASKRVGVHSMCSMQVPDSSALISVTDRMNASSSRTCPATSAINGSYWNMHDMTPWRDTGASLAHGTAYYADGKISRPQRQISGSANHLSYARTCVSHLASHT